MHGEDFEGSFASPFDALEGEGLGASGAPATVGAAYEKDAFVLIEFYGDNSRFKAFEEMEYGSLIETVDFL